MPRFRTWSRATAFFITVTLAAVSTLPVRAADTEVNIDNFAFTPKELTVKAGTTIVFRNRDDIPHSVVGSNGEFLRDTRHRGSVCRMGSNDTVAPVILMQGHAH
jgi:plastocyanin